MVVVVLNGAPARRGSPIGATVARAVSETVSTAMGVPFFASIAAPFAIVSPAPPYPVTAAADGSDIATGAPGRPATAWPIIAMLASEPWMRARSAA